MYILYSEFLTHRYKFNNLEECIVIIEFLLKIDINFGILFDNNIFIRSDFEKLDKSCQLI